MIEASWWFLLLLGAPLLVTACSFGIGDVHRVRALSVAAAALLLLVASLPQIVPSLAAAEIAVPMSVAPILGPTLLRVDGLSSLLLPLSALLWLVTLTAAPRASLDHAKLRRTALATAVNSCMFATPSLTLLVLLWAASVAIFLAALGARAAGPRFATFASAPESGGARRVAAAYLGASTVLFAVGALLLTQPMAGGPPSDAGVVLVLVAAMIRKGIFPFHAWVPHVFDVGGLGPAVLFSAPQVAAYVTALVVFPVASDELLRIVAILALVTAVYAAALALFQSDARRACGYLFVSQSALVMAGLDCGTTEALAGSVVLWISSAVSITGLSRCVLVLEARRGRLDLSRFHGGYDRMPLLAVSFLFFGLACTGFPGTLGFIGEELLLHGAQAKFPVLGFFVVVAGALTGLAVMRMYFSLFCGRVDTGGHLRLLRREALAFAGVAALLIGAGLAPGPLVGTAVSASERLMRGGEEGEGGEGKTLTRRGEGGEGAKEKP